MGHDQRFDRRHALAGAAALLGSLALGERALAQPVDRGQEAMDAAVELSRLEATAHLPALYTFYARLHPDGQAIVPRHVVIGWYQDNWLPKGPHPAVATGVRFTDWTWPVNGVTYRDVAEVSFTQTFEHAPAIADVVRLALIGDEWHWFFGRDKAWVEAQIAHYNDQAYIDQAGSVPFGLERVVGADASVIASLPLRVGGAQAEVVSDARQLPGYAARMPVAVQYREAEFPVGYALAATLRQGASMADTIDAIVWEHVQRPPFELQAWNLAPDNDVPFARYEHLASEAVGNAQTIVWGGADDATLWEISFVDEERLEELAGALVALAGR
jgi:hypothetical protein